MEVKYRVHSHFYKGSKSLGYFREIHDMKSPNEPLLGPTNAPRVPLKCFLGFCGDGGGHKLEIQHVNNPAADSELCVS